MQKVSVDRVEYDLEELRTEARQVRADTTTADQEIRHLQMHPVTTSSTSTPTKCRSP
jgi:hypothetical protein